MKIKYLSAISIVLLCTACSTFYVVKQPDLFKDFEESFEEDLTPPGDNGFKSDLQGRIFLTKLIRHPICLLQGQFGAAGPDAYFKIHDEDLGFSPQTRPAASQKIPPPNGRRFPPPAPLIDHNRSGRIVRICTRRKRRFLCLA